MPIGDILGFYQQLLPPGCFQLHVNPEAWEMRLWCPDTGLFHFALTQRHMAKTRLLHAALVLENNSILTVKLNNFQPFFCFFGFFSDYFASVHHSLCLRVCSWSIHVVSFSDCSPEISKLGIIISRK